MLSNNFNLRDIFPEVKFDITVRTQLDVILNELIEVETEVIKNNRKNTLYELVDVLQSTATALYKGNYSDNEINDAIRFVVEKNRKRGYYKE